MHSETHPFKCSIFVVTNDWRLLTMMTISVILTTYNSSRRLQQVLDSILLQQGIGESFLIQLIVADDCSTDDTHSILRDNQIEFIQTPTNTGGPNAGRNLALARVTGDFICITDHDDVWAANRIITLLPYLSKAPIVSSGFVVENTSTAQQYYRVKKRHDPHRIENYFPKNETFCAVLSRSWKGQTAYLGSLVYTSRYKNILFEEEYGMVDFDWILRLFHQQESLEVCAPLYTRYVDGPNLSLNPVYRKRDFDYSMKTLESYEAVYPMLVKKAKKSLYGSRARYFYVTGDMKNARAYLRRSSLTLTNIIYYITTYAGSSWVKKRFPVFG